jgi:hypothetical protein
MRKARHWNGRSGAAKLAVPLALLALAGCEVQRQPAGEAEPDPVINLPAVPVPQPPLDRAGLLEAVASAASAAAAGIDDTAAQRELDGRQFSVSIRFGCAGPAKDLQAAALGWRFDAQERTLRVRAMPTLSAQDPLVSRIVGDSFEAVEGFWLPRPWLRQAVCPVASAVTAAAAEPAATNDPDAQPEPSAQSAESVPAAPRIGIAQFFTSTDARTRRRSDRAYQAVQQVPPDQPLASQGFDLVLEGRLRAVPGKGVVLCSAAGPDSPPECIVSAEFDRVVIRRPNGGELIAEWGTG